MSKSVEYKNIHIHISFRVKCLMSIWAYVFYLFANETTVAKLSVG